MAKPKAPPPLEPGARRWALLAGASCLLPLLLQLPPQIAAAIAAAGIGVGLLSWRKPLPALLRLLMVIALVGAVLLMTRFAIGRDTGCALLAAMFALKPSETYTLRDARSLIGFALFGPFATFLLDQGPLSLTLGLAASVFALASLQRLAELESRVEPGRAVEAPLSHWQRLIAIGRLIGIGLPLALAVFWLFPRLSAPLWGVPERAIARPGLSDRMTPGEMVDLMNDETVTLRARFNGAAPPTSQMYWRGPVLWNFDGRTWTQPRWFRGIEPAPFTPSATVWDYELEVEPTDDRQFVALDLPLAAPNGSQLSLDHGIYAPRALSALSRWHLRSSPPAAYEPQLRAVLRRAALDLPQNYNPRTVALGRQWRAEAGANDAAVVERALALIRRDFVYTLATPLLGRHAVDEFLFDYKAGFCEHFSSSFVVLMRAAGIPARVVTGYAGGYYNPVGRYWLVRRSDAHAWAEVWLQGRGWVRVDPTAAVAPERIYDTLADRAPGAGGLFGGIGGATPLFNLSDWARRGWNDFVLGFDASRQERLLRPFGVDRLDGAKLVMLFVLFASAAGAWMVWLSSRGERQRDPALRAWHALGRRYRKLGLEREPHEPALAWAERVGKARPDLGISLLQLSQHFSDWRYAEGQPGRREARELRNELVRALRAHRPGRTGERR
ncbi:transglutaminase TgpA family protein [Lysobacter sp. CA199]|uniref:transglutaminase TgpA family protein n=1 Tax=Lysobacter sp. CA199 TaxID=3455608 RepID=UPI003F8D8BC1